MEPGTLLKQARNDAGLTQRQLADRLGVSQPVLARLESASSNPRLATLRRALRAAGSDLRLELAPAPPAVDETMIAANMRLEPRDRLSAFAASYRRVAELARKAVAP